MKDNKLTNAIEKLRTEVHRLQEVAGDAERSAQSASRNTIDKISSQQDQTTIEIAAARLEAKRQDELRKKRDETLVRRLSDLTAAQNGIHGQNS